MPCVCFQRARKERKLYSDEWALGDDDIDGNISVFSIADKVEDPQFSQNFVKEMNGPGEFSSCKNELDVGNKF